jgi:RNAse (barnase) inhibitor barstar
MPLEFLYEPNELLAHPPGVYRLAAHSRREPILQTITDWGWYAGYIDGRIIEDKQTFLRTAGEALAFPAYYGMNWDAFEEMVNDLSWLQATGYALLYDHVYRFAAYHPNEWHTALSILQSACTNWQREGIPFYVLLRHYWRWDSHLPSLAV